MAMTAAESVFVDTNVLVYATQAASAHHAAALALLRSPEAAGIPLWISDQVLREFLAVVTRPQPAVPTMPMALAIEQVKFFSQRFWIAVEGPAVRTQLLALLSTYPTAGRQVHDANIVATMLANSIKHLLTFNGSDFRRFASLISVETP
jgi:predicted nucleic acid-binding protein